MVEALQEQDQVFASVTQFLGIGQLSSKPVPFRRRRFSGLEHELRQLFQKEGVPYVACGLEDSHRSSHNRQITPEAFAKKLIEPRLCNIAEKLNACLRSY